MGAARVLPAEDAVVVEGGRRRLAVVGGGDGRASARAGVGVGAGPAAVSRRTSERDGEAEVGGRGQLEAGLAAFGRQTQRDRDGAAGVGRRTERELEARRADAARHRGRPAPSLFAGDGRLRLVPRFELVGEALVANDDLAPRSRPRSAAPGRNARPAGPAAVVRLPAPVVRQRPERPTAATYRRRRLVAGAIVVAFVLAGGWSLGARTTADGAPATSSIESAQPVSQGTYVVQPGDTLWSIVRKTHPGSAAGGDDLRPMVDALAAQRHGRPLEVGETIVLP